MPHWTQQRSLFDLPATLTAGRQARVDRLEAFSPELQAALAWHMVPKLTVKGLMAFACTCKAFRSTAYLRDEPWRSLAADDLPPLHPSLAGLDRAAVQKVLQVL